MVEWNEQRSKVSDQRWKLLNNLKNYSSADFHLFYSHEFAMSTAGGLNIALFCLFAKQ